MKDIEALAVECGFIPHAHEDGESYASIEDLEAFAKALQGDVGEPVAEVVEDKYLDGVIKVFMILKDIPVGTKLYTSPPNTSAKLDKAEARIKELELENKRYISIGYQISHAASGWGDDIYQQGDQFLADLSQDRPIREVFIKAKP